MVTPFLKQTTKNKVKMTTSANLERDAGELLGSEVSAWVLAEIADNKGNADKEWWEHRIMPGGALKAHDARGTASFLASKAWRYNMMPHQIKSTSFDAAAGDPPRRATASAGSTAASGRITKIVEL